MQNSPFVNIVWAVPYWINLHTRIYTHIYSWIKRDHLDVTCFFISLFNAQHVSDVITAILRSLRLICWCRLKHCFNLHPDTTPPQPNHNVTPTHVVPEQYNPWNNSTNSRKLLRMDVLTSETCWALNNEIKKQVASSWSLFIQLSRWCTVQ